VKFSFVLHHKCNRNGMKLVWREVRWKNGKEIFKAKQLISYYFHLSSWTCVQVCEGSDYRDVGFVSIIYIKLHWWSPPPLSLSLSLLKNVIRWFLDWKAAVCRFIYGLQICVFPNKFESVG
jgi:hypothetical protein